MTDGIAELAPFRGLFAILDILERLGIRYAIGGSLASSLHGEPRSTADFDLLLELGPEQVAALVRALEPTCCVDASAAADATRRAGSFNVIHLDTMQKIDLFVAGELGVDDLLRRALSEAGIVDPSPTDER